MKIFKLWKSIEFGVNIFLKKSSLKYSMAYDKKNHPLYIHVYIDNWIW